MENPHLSALSTVETAHGHIDCGTSQCPCAGGKCKQKAVWELGHCWQKARRHIGCSFAIHGRCKLPPTVDPFAVFLWCHPASIFAHFTPFSSICCNLPSLKAPFLFLFLPRPCTGELILLPCAGGWQRMLLLLTLAAGRDPLPSIRKVEQMRSTHTVLVTGGFPQ